ncbi:hypothetical protein BD779DRAFT_1674379 [Infundibulicybe gibba]|nr:hypothetical protein BD779DRAFT_1674379 [Infundibulicybe gibba]
MSNGTKGALFNPCSQTPPPPLRQYQQMDEHYNIEKAAQTLEALAQMRAESAYSGIQLSELCKSDNWSTGYSAVRIGNPPVWRLIKTTDESSAPGTEVGTTGEMEELVVSVQGIIVGRDELPPFASKISPNSKHLRYIRQGVSISGLGTTSFMNAIDSLKKIYALFSRSVGSTNLQSGTPTTTLGDYPTIEAFNRYFTAKKAGAREREYALSVDVDPFGTLAGALGTGYYHGEDNIVNYYERTNDSHGDHRYLPAAPVKMQVGDIIEIQMSLIVVPLRGGLFKMSSVLRSVTLMDGQYTQNATVARLDNQVAKEGPTRLKRKVGYGEEEIGKARAKMARMEIDSRSTEQ